MKTYIILSAEDVPHYAHGDVEVRPQRRHRKGPQPRHGYVTSYDPDWSGAVSRRIVSIEDPDGRIVAQDIPLDNFVLHNADAAEAMFEALCAQEMADFDPEASRRKGYFDNALELRKNALAKALEQS